MWRRTSISSAIDSGDGALLLIFLLLALCLSCHVQAQITHPDEIKALRAIKSSLIDPMKNLSTWNSGDPCTSNWTGVFCFNETFEDGYLHLRKLELMRVNLSGTLAPEVGLFSRLRILSFMWNKIGGVIPEEIGNLTTLELLLLNGNQLTGSLPDGIGYLPKLRRIQIDQNKISGSIPKSFANLNETRHFHMNNNSISGEIPSELSRLPKLIHFLLDNNNLSGSLPAELSKLPNLLILQLDNNNFNESEIPASFGNMTKLLKLSLRNCSLKGSIPDLSRIANLSYIDLSLNQLNGPIPTEKLSDNMTTIILSHNNLNETIPEAFSSLPRRQKLSLDNNVLTGSVPSTLWESRRSNTAANLTLNFRYNKLTEIVGNSSVPANVTLLLEGNPLCSNNSIGELYCGFRPQNNNAQDMTNHTAGCPSLACPRPYEYTPSALTGSCYCAAPLIIYFRLKSPTFSEFLPFQSAFEEYLTSELSLKLEQLNISSIVWQEGPRLKMDLKLFPVYDNGTQDNLFKTTEVRRIWRMLTGWEVPDHETFGPYELLDIILLDPYKSVFLEPSSPGLSKGALAGIIIGTLAGVALLAIVSLFIAKKYWRKNKGSRLPIVKDVRKFTYAEMALATGNFSRSAELGQGGYGKVYKGTLADGTLVAIKRRTKESLQGDEQFNSEVGILSKLHHRYLVSLVGYCYENREQMLVYDFMENGTLSDHISARSDRPLRFATRLRIALESSRGILYLHTEAHDVIFHRDIKSTNILLDSKFTAKVADFGLSRLAPVPNTQGIVNPGDVTTDIKGTPGYVDPEYFLTRIYTDKSDVYSLGVVFLELLTGRRPIIFGRHIVAEVSTSYQSGDILSVVDERMGSYPRECVERFASLALKCCLEKGAERPTMSEVVRELETIIQMIPESDVRSATESSSNYQTRRDSPSSSSPTMRDPFVSSNDAGSNLISGTFPSIRAR